MADRDKGKEKALEPLEVGIKKKKMENTSDGQLDDAEAAAAAGKKLEAKEDTVLSTSEEILEGAEAEYSTEETVISTSDEFDVLCSRSPVLLSPTESSTNNPPMGIKKIKNVNVEQAAADEELILSPKESSTNINPKGGMKRVRQEEEEDKKKKLLKAADSLSDTGTSTSTSKFPTSPIDKFMDSDKDDQSMRSPPGDQSSSHRKNLI